MHPSHQGRAVSVPWPQHRWKHSPMCHSCWLAFTRMKAPCKSRSLSSVPFPRALFRIIVFPALVLPQFHFLSMPAPLIFLPWTALAAPIFPGLNEGNEDAKLFSSCHNLIQRSLAIFFCRSRVSLPSCEAGFLPCCARSLTWGGEIISPVAHFYSSTRM